MALIALIAAVGVVMSHTILGGVLSAMVATGATVVVRGWWAIAPAELQYIDPLEEEFQALERTVRERTEGLPVPRICRYCSTVIPETKWVCRGCIGRYTNSTGPGPR